MKHVPNVLTILRIVVTPVLLVLLFRETFMGQLWALVLFVLASISDYLDGKLARSYKVGSRLGQFLDPLADKVLVLGTFIALVLLTPEIVTWWGVALIALRDVFVTVLRSWAEARGRTVRTLPAAKAKTAAQLTFLISVLVFRVAATLPPPVGAWAEWLLTSTVLFVVFLLVVAVTLWTGALYAFNLEYAEPAQQNG